VKKKEERGEGALKAQKQGRFFIILRSSRSAINNNSALKCDNRTPAEAQCGEILENKSFIDAQRNLYSLFVLVKFVRIL
jgi:hypothetical protein